MNDCQNVVIRDQLPDFLHGTLESRAYEIIEEHVAGCEDCTAELALLRDVLEFSQLQSVAVRIDVASISAQIPPYKREKRGIRVERSMMRLAAGLLIAAIGVSTVVVTSRSGVDNIVPVDSIAMSYDSVNRGNVEQSPVGLSLVSVSALSADQLEALLNDVDNLEALPVEETGALLMDPIAAVSYDMWRDM